MPHFQLLQKSSCEPHESQQGQMQDPAPGSGQSLIAIQSGGEWD